MQQVTAIDEFCQGRVALPELLSQIERTFAAGDREEQTALRDSWRKNEFKKVLDQRVFHLIDEKIETEYKKTLLGQISEERSEDKTVIIPSPVTLRTGYVLKGRFILEEMLGSGGMGVVFRAIDLRKKEAQDRDPSIAIKVLSEDFRKHPDSFRALQREARKAQNLAHPNIITVYDFDREDSLIYLTMEYLSGASLEKRMKTKKPPWPVAEALSIIKSVGAALAYAHENGIVHSDLKPANIFVTDSGRVKVIDFGIARAMKRPGQTDGGDTTVFDAGALRALTPAYASIEMIEGREPDARDDLFALGCIAYELVAGRHPYGRMMATEARAEGLVPKRPNALTARQWRALLGALSLDRENRTASVDQFTQDFLASEKTVALTPMRIGAAAAISLAALVAIYVVAANPFRSTAGNSNPPVTDNEAADAVRQEAQRQARKTATKEAERRAAEAAKRETDRLAAEAAKREADRQAADAAKREADRLAAEAAKREADRQAAEAAKRETDRVAAEAAKREADRQAAEAAKRETDRLAAETAKREADRQAAEAAKREADRVAAEATKKEADRQAAESAKKEADRLAAEAAKKEADRLAADTAKKSTERRAAEAAKKEADRQAAQAAKLDADRKAAEAKALQAANKDARQSAANAVKQPTSAAPGATQQTAALTIPKLNETALLGAWCSGSVKIRLTPTEWQFQLADGTQAKLAVNQYRVSDEKVLLYSTDNRERESVTEFGNISSDQMTQIRGRLVGADSWNNYNRIFKKC